MFTRSSVALKAATALTLAMIAGGAMAESQYGYAASGSGTVTAKANVNLSVTVPKLILLRVGSANNQIDTLSWTVPLSIPAVPTSPADGNNTVVNWDGTAPTVGTLTDPAALSVYAWTNASGGGSLSYSATAFAAGGPTLAAISVTSTGLAHPTPAALATASTGATPITKNTLATGTWAYKLTGTGAASWAAGSYTSTVTYTATSI